MTNYAGDLCHLVNNLNDCTRLKKHCTRLSYLTCFLINFRNLIKEIITNAQNPADLMLYDMTLERKHHCYLFR